MNKLELGSAIVLFWATACLTASSALPGSFTDASVTFFLGLPMAGFVSSVIVDARKKRLAKADPQTLTMVHSVELHIRFLLQSEAPQDPPRAANDVSVFSGSLPAEITDVSGFVIRTRMRKMLSQETPILKILSTSGP